MRSGPLWEKKQKRCDKEDPADATQGDQWDHIGIDVQNRFVVSFVIGKRSKKNVEKVVGDFAERTGNIPPALITTDDCSTYEGALERQYGETIVPEKTGKRGRPRKSYKQWPEKSVYATVNKTYGKGKVTGVEQELVHGTEADLAKALECSSSSDKINTSFVERQNGTDRTYNARKARKTYEFSRQLLAHIALSWWVMLCYNFHHTHAGLRERVADGTYLHRTPAMAIGLASHPLTVWELLSTQVVGFVPSFSLTSEDLDAQIVHPHDP
jgi:IS1 family transposase